MSEESVAVAEYSYFLSSFLGSLLCRKCGHDITTAVHLYNKASKLALRQRNDTILGVQQRLIQLFKNPHGTLIYAIVFLYHCQTISSATSRPLDKSGGGGGRGCPKKFFVFGGFGYGLFNGYYFYIVSFLFVSLAVKMLFKFQFFLMILLVLNAPYPFTTIDNNV